MRATVAWMAMLAACAAEPVTEQTASSPVRDLPVSDGWAAAGQGWTNRPIPQHRSDQGTMTLAFEAVPYNDSGGPIDAVIGLSSQRADAFGDLAAIVRFAPSGRVDVRDGGGYRADIAFPYTLGHEYGIRMVVDLYAKRYSVEIQDVTWGVGNDWQRIATGYAFRTEQAVLAHVDNVASIVDSATGGIATNTFEKTPDICISGAPGWVAFPFPTQTGHALVQADVWINPGSSWDAYADAVLVLSRNHPRAFTDGAAILRFRPDGYFDARNGSTYAALEPVPAYAGFGYRVYFWVDHAAKRYSVSVHDLDDAHGGYPNHHIARDYAYRTEQQSAISLGWIGGFVDGPGSIRFCNIYAFTQ